MWLRSVVAGNAESDWIVGIESGCLWAGRSGKHYEGSIELMIPALWLTPPQLGTETLWRGQSLLVKC